MDKLIEDIYSNFSKYKLKDVIKTIDPSPVSEVLYTKSLKQLSGSDLWEFTFECMLTQGDENDFKYFLPRILELFSSGELAIDNFILTDKFKRADWRTWADKEQQLIESYFLCIWETKIKQNHLFDCDSFVEFMLLFEDVTLLLTKWQIQENEPGLHALIDFLFNEYIQMCVHNRWHTYKKLDKKYLLQVNSWLKNQLPILENILTTGVIKDKNLSENLAISIEYIKAFG